MKKLFILFLSIIMVLSLMAGCGAGNTNSDANSQMGANAGGDTGKDTSENSDNNSKNPSANASDKSESNQKQESSEAPVLSESQLVMIMEVLGISAEEFYSFSVEKQVALLAELGVVAGELEEKESEKESIKTYTSDDVAAGGNYKVTMGDSMMWNYYEFYYEDGKIVKITMSFRKNDEEEPDISTLEGADLQDNKFYGMTVEEIENEFNNKGYGYHTYIHKLNK